MSDSTWADEPWEIADIPGRLAFANALIGRIASTPRGQASTVFGLVGPWGSGKTTVLRHLQRELRGWTVLEFAPWSAPDTESIAAEFVRTLAQAFPSTRPRRWKKSLRGLAAAAPSLLSLVPYAGNAANGVARLGVEALLRTPPWPVTFKRLSDLASRLERPVLILVDDVDRLDGEELRSLLKIVRLLGRFTNIHYLVAYDQGTVEALLDAQGFDRRAGSFMEKIVQYPFELPPLSDVARRRMITAALVDVLGSASEAASREASERSALLIDILTEYLRTPRAITRYREQLRVMLPLARQAELNLMDFAALTWIRVAHHDLWAALPMNRDALLGGAALWGKESEDPTDLLRRGLRDSGIELVESAQSVLGLVFPRMAGDGNSRGQRHSAADPQYFQRYFLLDLPEDDVSDLLVEGALENLAAGVTDAAVDELVSILDGADGARACLAFEKVLRARSESGEGNRRILDFARARLSARADEARDFGAPVTYAERWIPIELHGCLRAGTASIDDAVSWFGLLEVTRLAYAIRRANRPQETEIKGYFAPLAEQIRADISEESASSDLNDRSLTWRIGFVSWALGKDAAHGILSHRVSGADSLLELAASFVTAQEWVGSETHWELHFNSDEFEVAVGAELIIKFGLTIDAPRQLSFNVDDRTTPDVMRNEAVDFAANSLAALATRLKDDAP